jgi:hypothetical protein
MICYDNPHIIFDLYFFYRVHFVSFFSFTLDPMKGFVTASAHIVN